MCTIDPNDFVNFNPDKYNSLPEVDVASSNLQKCSDLAELLEKIFSLTKKHSLELGVRLVHRHMQVDEGKVMVERFQFHQNVPAFTTSAHLPTDQIYPASWLLEDNSKFSVFEYSTDILVRYTLEKLIKDPSIFMKICELIREYHFENLLAPCITARDSLKQFDKKNGFMEFTDLETNVSIVKNTKDQTICSHEGALIITTLWAYPVNENCLRGDYQKNSDNYNCSHCWHDQK
ncbi:1079_t:CDS:1 [Dentiscutata heterogama]|uniref:1079_t:CDS:1 n=1 Tax=Dentiscutata heterogama TaxID=1316150 RepID=A0ACA9LV26_9GLOM|nr:1079_t:CDS:1 [Dentiscutata heterogama]